MNAHRARPRRRDHHLDPAELQVELAARRPDRPRRAAATGVPVEHVVSEPERASELPAAGEHAAAADGIRGDRPRPRPRAQPARGATSSSRIDPQLLGVLLFIISEAMLFGSFFTAYFFIRVVGNEPWPPEPFHFPVNVALHEHRRSWCPRASRCTTRCTRSSTDNRIGLQVGLVTTFLMGADVPVAPRSTSTSRPASRSTTARSRRSSTASPDCTGCTSSSGLTLLAIMNIRAFRGHFSPPRPTWASRWPASTGTSSTSCGSSCS